MTASLPAAVLTRVIRFAVRRCRNVVRYVPAASTTTKARRIISVRRLLRIIVMVTTATRSVRLRIAVVVATTATVRSRIRRCSIPTTTTARITAVYTDISTGVPTNILKTVVEQRIPKITVVTAATRLFDDRRMTSIAHIVFPFLLRI